MSELPEGWTTASIAEVADVIAGQAPPGASYNKTGDGLPLYQGKTDFGDVHLGPPKLWTTNPSKCAEANDVLLSVRAPVGPTNLASADCGIGRGLAAIRSCRGISPSYLMYAIRATARRLEGQATGTTFSAIGSSVVRNHCLPIAPTAEQERLVAAIEEQFSRLDAGVVALGRVRVSLKRMRAAVLQATAIRQPGWEDAQIEKTMRVVDYRGRTPPFSATGIPHLRSFNIKNGAVVWNGCAYVSRGTYDKYMSRGFPASGDLLFTTEAPMGEVALAPKEQFCMAQRMMLLKPDAKVWNSRYLMYHLRSAWVQRKLRLNATGTTVQGISSRNFRPLLLLAPPLSDQGRMADLISGRLAVIDALERDIGIVGAHGAALRASILATAFAGKLVPQDPTDEPASALLERIAAERASSNGHKPAKARSRRRARTTT